MKNKIYTSFDAAVADIPDGITFMSPGFGNVGVPRNLLAALHRHGAKNLTGISNNAGALDEAPDLCPTPKRLEKEYLLCNRCRSLPLRSLWPFFVGKVLGYEVGNDPLVHSLNGNVLPHIGDRASGSP